MNRKLIVLALAAGFATGAWAQVSVTLEVNGVTDPRTFVLEELIASGRPNGTMTVRVTEDTGGEPPDPTPIATTLTVTAPTNGQIINNADGSPISGVLNFSYMSNETAPSISMRLLASAGYVPSAWGNACTGVSPTGNCVLSMSANRTVSATFTADTPPPEGECGPTPANVSIVQTTAQTLRYVESVANTNTSKDKIYAYRFTTLSGGTTGRAQATRMTAGEGKYAVITKCPGDIANPVAARGCDAYSTESTSVNYAIKPTSKDWRLYCHLEPAATYYLNVVNRSSFSTPPTCTTNCGFYFQID